MSDQTIAAEVDPSLLEWARLQTDLTPIAASRKMGLDDDVVARWESGDLQPSIGDLKSAARVYRRALCVFFLPEPPEGFDTMRDFRRHVGVTRGAWSAELGAEVQRALAQRDNLLEVLALDGRSVSRDWQLHQLPSDDRKIAQTARAKLLRHMPGSPPTAASDRYEHWGKWSAALELSGVLVLATEGGRVATSEMRGLSILFDELPCITVNGADAVRGRLFTLLHEYAHLVLRTAGLCDTTSDRQPTAEARQIETRCNSIAAQILMPADLVLAMPAVKQRLNRHEEWTYEALRDAAASYGVSAEAFLRRLTELRRVPLSHYQQLRDEFSNAIENDAAVRNGGDFYRTTARDRGKGYIRTIADAHRRGLLGSFEAATYLGVKVSQIERLAAAAALPPAWR